VLTFLDDFSRSVRLGDFESMRKHFSESVVSYGTRVLACHTLEDLVALQWKQIWGKCASWDVTSVDAIVFDSDLGFVAFRWRRVSQKDQEQTGRATLCFQFIESRLVVSHSHFSESPENS
jgi:hypothetical protein